MPKAIESIAYVDGRAAQRPVDMAGVVMLLRPETPTGIVKDRSSSYNSSVLLGKNLAFLEEN